MQKLTDGQPTVEVLGKTVREVVKNLEAAYPGTQARLVDGFKLKPNISVAVDGEVTPIGMLQRSARTARYTSSPPSGEVRSHLNENYPNRDPTLTGQLSVPRNLCTSVIPAKAGIQRGLRCLELPTVPPPVSYVKVFARGGTAVPARSGRAGLPAPGPA